MTAQAYKRMTRYAGFSLVQVVIVAAVVLAGVEAGLVGVIVLATAVPLVWAWGLYQADVALNPLLDEAGRTQWRMAVWFVPGSMALYWWRHVRGRPVG